MNEKTINLFIYQFLRVPDVLALLQQQVHPGSGAAPVPEVADVSPDALEQVPSFQRRRQVGLCPDELLTVVLKIRHLNETLSQGKSCSW